MAEPKVMRLRPVIGAVTTSEKKVRICSACGCLVWEEGLCNIDCGQDGERRTAENTFWAVYEVRETFLRDEPYNP